MDQEMNDFLESVKALAFVKHSKVESLKNSAKLERHLSESGKLSLNALFNLVCLKNMFIKFK